MQEMLDKRETMLNTRYQIQDTIEDLNTTGSIIDSVGMLVDKLKEESDVVVKGHLVLDVLKKDMGMNYKKIKPVSVHCNS